MCEIYVDVRRWEPQRRVLDGRFVIEPDKPSMSKRNWALLFCDDGRVFLDDGKLQAVKGVLHYLILEIDEHRLLAFGFGIDFTAGTPGSIADSLIAGLRGHAARLQDVLSDVNDCIATLEVALRGLCQQLPTQETLARVQELKQQGEPFPRIVHSPALVAERFRSVVEASDAFRARDASRAMVA